MNQQMAYCARGRVLATVGSASALLKSGTFLESSVTVTTGTVTSTTASFAQGMEYVAVEVVNAGADGMEMRVRSGSAQTILNDPVGQDCILMFVGH